MMAKNHNESTERTTRKRVLPPPKDGWSVETPYLKQLKATHRARAREAMRWRPLFLKALAMAGGYMFALRATGVCYNTFRAHERNDPEFALQVREAEAARAQLLLAETDLSVTQISSRVGYSSPSHFSKAFRQATGLTPRAFRAALVSR